MNIPLEYKPSNTFKPEDAEDPTHKGHELLCESRLLKRIRVNANGSVNWMCKNKATKICSGSITIDAKETITRHVPHSSECKPLSETELLALNFTRAVQVRVSTEHESIRKICEEERAKLSEAGDFDNEQIANAIPDSKLRSMSSALKYRATKTRPKLPDSIRQILLEGKYTETIACTNNSKKFLIFQSKNNKNLVFSSKVQLEVLS